MKKLLPISLIGMLVLMMLLPFGSAFAYTGGLLNGKTLYHGKDYNTKDYTATKTGDNIETTEVSIGNNGSILDTLWYEFENPVNIDQYYLLANSTGLIITFVDSSNNVISTIDNINNTGSIVDIPLVNNVKKVALSTTGSSVLVQEFDVFGSVVQPIQYGYFDDYSSNITTTYSNIIDNDLSTTANISGSDEELFSFENPVDITNLFLDYTGSPSYATLKFLDSSGNQVNYIVATNVPDGSSVPFVANGISSVKVSTSGNTFTLNEIEFTGSSVGTEPEPEPEIDLVPPGEITNLIGNATENTINLSWTNPADEDFRTVYIYQDDSLIGTSSNGSYVVDGLQSDTEYVFKFVTEDNTGNFSTGTTQTIRTLSSADVLAPNAPGGLYVDSGNQALYISWDSNTEDTAGYNIYIDGVKKNSSLIRNTFFSATNLINDQEYSVTITAVDYSGNESVESAAVMGTPLSSGLPLIQTDYELSDVALGIESWFTSYWSILAFAIAIPLSFYIAARIKLLFLD